MMETIIEAVVEFFLFCSGRYSEKNPKKPKRNKIQVIEIRLRLL
ncbi:hypothetical protein ACFL6G_07890 [candidate division KSB1 bacterium]